MSEERTVLFGEGCQPEILSLEASRLSPESPEGESLEAEFNRIFPNRSVKRILFINPPTVDARNFGYYTCKLGRYPNFPPYGTGTLASRLRKEGILVDILNLNNAVLRACRFSKNEEEFDFRAVVTAQLTQRLENFQPDLIGITCMFSQTHPSVVDICHRIKQIVQQTPLVLGGVHITNSLVDEKTRNIFLKDFPMVNFFFLYESDLSFPAFVRVVHQKAPLTELAQVLVNGESTKLHITTRRSPSSEDLNIIPAHDLITSPDLAANGKIGDYHTLSQPSTRFSTVLSNRGCRAQCTFCSVRNFNGPGVRGRSVQSVIDELLMLRQEYGIGHIMWLDDDFLKDHERALRLFNEMVRQDVGITWDCTNGVIAFSCTEELIAAAAESGCVGLHIGMESGNPQILREIKKPGTVEIFLRAAKVLHKYEQVNARVFLMLGFPHETFRMVEDTFRVAQEMDLDWHMITPLQPLPNTPIFGQMAGEGLLEALAFDEIRFRLGAQGTQRKETERRVNVFSTDFEHIFEEADPDAIPTKPQINRLWAYMNYHLNFERLFREKRSAKHVQLYKYFSYISDVVAPDDAFAQYFRGYLHWKVYGRSEPGRLERLKAILTENPDWQERFDDFHLSVEDLETRNFPDGKGSEKVVEKVNVAR